PFARHYSGNHCCFLLLRLLRCFSSARSRIIRCTFSTSGYPIRKPADQFVFADPRGLSQLVASFIASESLGIPRVPFLTFFPYMALLLPYGCFAAQLRTAAVAFSMLLFSSSMSKNLFG